MNSKTKIMIGILIAGIILISGCVEQPEISATTPTVTPSVSGNYISISHYQKNDNDVLLFDVNFQNYSVESKNLSYLMKYNPSYKEFGSDLIVPSKFNYTVLPFIKIKTDNDNTKCKPEISYLKIDIILPLNSNYSSKLLEFKEEKLEEKIDIAPTIACSKHWKKSQCIDCPDYLKENEFFPEEISLHTDVSTFDVKKNVRIYLPLFRHNPNTRETNMVRNAKIMIRYKLHENNLLLLEEEYIPSEVAVLKPFNITYKIINPTTKKIDNLKIEAAIKNPFGQIVQNTTSKEFSINHDELKIISFGVDSFDIEQGSYKLIPRVLENSKTIGIGDSEYIFFAAPPVKMEVNKPSSIVTITDTFSVNITNNGDFPLTVNPLFYFSTIDHNKVATLNYAVWYNSPKILNTGKTEVFKIAPSLEILRECYKGCKLNIVVELKHNDIPIGTLKRNDGVSFKSYAPRYCEEDSDCICCDSLVFSKSSKWKNTAVNKFYAEKYNCTTTSNEYCSHYKPICNKEDSQCKTIEQ